MTSDKKIVSNISKWFPKSASLKSSSDKIFSNAKILERELLILGNKLTHATKDVNLLDPAVSMSGSANFQNYSNSADVNVSGHRAKLVFHYSEE